MFLVNNFLDQFIVYHSKSSVFMISHIIYEMFILQFRDTCHILFLFKFQNTLKKKAYLRKYKTFTHTLSGHCM